MKKEKIPLKGGDEYDVHTGWRKLLLPHKNMIKKAKRSYNKRFRKQMKDLARMGNEQ